jgi:hypothetical protein
VNIRTARPDDLPTLEGLDPAARIVMRRAIVAGE